MRAVTCLALLGAATALHLEFSSNYSSYSVTDNGRTLFESKKGVAVFADGKWQSQHDNTLKLSSHKQVSEDDAVFGAMQGEQLTWSWDHCTNCMHTQYMNYGTAALGSGVVFTITFDHGANGTSLVDYTGANRDNVITNFPAFGTTAKDKLPDTLSWQGSFVGANVGTYEKNSQGSEGGPTVFFDHSDQLLKTVVIGSALNNFKSTSAGPGKVRCRWVTTTRQNKNTNLLSPGANRLCSSGTVLRGGLQASPLPLRNCPLAGRSSSCCTRAPVVASLRRSASGGSYCRRTTLRTTSWTSR
jgi:hypothetical protein